MVETAALYMYSLTYHLQLCFEIKWMFYNDSLLIRQEMSQRHTVLQWPPPQHILEPRCFAAFFSVGAGLPLRGNLAGDKNIWKETYNSALKGSDYFDSAPLVFSALRFPKKRAFRRAHDLSLE